ncbi:MAG: ATP-binding protein [Labedaea sp.]
MESRFRILGRTRLLIGDHLHDRWGHAKLRGILAVLLLHAPRSVSVDTLIDWVWPEGKTPREMATFYTYKNRIQDALARMAAPPRIVSGGGSYRIEVDRDEVDFFEFRTVAARARALVREADHEAAIRLITPAIELWHDIPLADAEGEPAREWRSWAQTMHLVPANETLLLSLSALDRNDEVLHRLADLPMEHQANLTLVKRRLEALHQLSRYTEATTYYLGMRKRLKETLDQDEADDLTRFYDELRSRGPVRQAAGPGPPVETTRLGAAAHLLPYDVGDFSGREDLLDQLDAMVSTSTGDVVTGVIGLDGPAGVGKTTFAVHWAHLIADRFPGGQLFVDLNGFGEGPMLERPEVVDRFLAALDFPVERIPDAAGRAAKLRVLLGGTRTLVLLDNARSSDQVIPLLDVLPACLVLVTSRRRLTGLSRRGAMSLTVAPLAFQEAKNWLARMVGARAGTQPDAVAELAAMCGGYPLAVRGIADHVGTRPRVRLDEFVDELRDTHVLLRLGDDGDGPDGSVRTVLSWSYRNLAADERQLFRLLGLHPGPDISVDLAAALAGRAPPETKKTLDALVNAHLLTQPESRSRFRFHDLVRAYAAECAAAPDCGPESSSAELRMLSYYLHTAANADGAVFPYRPRIEVLPLASRTTPTQFADEEAAISWCVRERANLSAIIQYAGSHAFPEYAFKLPGAAGEILQRLGYYHDVLAALTVAVESARLVGDSESEADSLSNLGFVHVTLHNFELAESCLQKADRLYQEIGYEVGVAWVMHFRARLNVERGDFQRAIDLNLAALPIIRNTRSPGLETTVLVRLAEAYRRAGNLDAAITHGRDALWLAEHHGSQHGQALTELGAIYYESGDLTAARAYASRALAVHERQRNFAQVGRTFNLLAAAHRALNDPAEAERCCRQALHYCRSARDARGEARALDGLGQLLHAQARLDEAADAWTKALPIFEDLADPLAASIRARLTELGQIAEPFPPLGPSHWASLAESDIGIATPSDLIPARSRPDRTT